MLTFDRAKQAASQRAAARKENSKVDSSKLGSIDTRLIRSQQKDGSKVDSSGFMTWLVYRYMAVICLIYLVYDWNLGLQILRMRKVEG